MNPYQAPEARLESAGTKTPSPPHGLSIWLIAALHMVWGVLSIVASVFGLIQRQQLWRKLENSDIPFPQVGFAEVSQVALGLIALIAAFAILRRRAFGVWPASGFFLWIMYDAWQNAGGINNSMNEDPSLQIIAIFLALGFLLTAAALVHLWTLKVHGRLR